jgi:hypothetical protein
MPYMERDYSRATTLEWCRRIDAGPFSTLSCGERITSYTQDMRVVLAAAAALTSRVRIMPSLYVLPIPAVLAENRDARRPLGGRVTVTVGRQAPGDYRRSGAAERRTAARRGRRRDAPTWAGSRPSRGTDPVGPTPVQPAGRTSPERWAQAIRAAAWADGIYGWSMDSLAPVKQQFDLARGAGTGPARRASGSSPDSGSRWPTRRREAQAYVYDCCASPARKARERGEQMKAAHRRDQRLDAIEAEGADECLLVPATLELAEVERAAELVARR